MPAELPPQEIATSAEQLAPPSPRPRETQTPAPAAAPAARSSDAAKPLGGFVEGPIFEQPVPDAPAIPPDVSVGAPAGKISLRVQEESIRKALDLLSTQSGVNIIPSVGVTGSVTVNLKDVTFEQALDVLVKVGNLSVRRDGRMVYVFTAQEAADMETKGKIPLVRVYALNYCRAGDIAQMISPFLSKDGTISVTPANDTGIGASTAAGANSGSGGFSSLANGGTIGGGPGAGTPAGGGTGSGGASAAGSSVSTGSDSGGNSLAGGDTLVVRDYAENLAHIDEIVARIDVQPMQVLIEAVILSVQLDNTQQLGVNFGLVDNMRNVAGVAGNGNLINAAAGFSPAKVLTTTAAVAPSLLPRAGQLVSGYLSPDQGLKFGFIDNNVSGFVRALETTNKVNILASPRVLVLNKQRAEIQLGQRLGYRNTVTNLTSSLQTVQFLSVGTLLSLRPFVSQDGMVRMELHPEKSTGALDANGIPQTVTSELTTNILVPDGATIVIGGLIDSTDSNLQQGVLGLNRLPIVGPLFRERVTKATKTELIVLLTPRVLNRAGLPEPSPGLAPRGPSGLPNSGPMPGPAMFADRIEPTPDAPIDLPPLPAVVMDPAPTVSARLKDYRWIGAPEVAPRDATVRTASHVAPIQAPEPERAPAAPIQAPAVAVAVAAVEPSAPIAAAPPPPLRSDAEPAPTPTPAPASPPNPAPVAMPPKPTPSLPGADPSMLEIPIRVSAAPAAPPGKPHSHVHKDERPVYHPGDLTRGLIDLVKVRSAERAAKAKSTREAPAASLHVHVRPPAPVAPVATTPQPPSSVAPPAERLAGYVVEAPAQPAGTIVPTRRVAPTAPPQKRGQLYGWYTVQKGEDFAALAERFYGSSSLRGALWKLNRHLVPHPEQLEAGTMILIPTSEVLDRVVQEGIEATTGGEAGRVPLVDEGEEAPRERPRFRLFGKR